MSTKNNTTTSIDPSEFSDRIGSSGLTGNANRRVMESDKWAGQTKFHVIVLTRPMPQRASMTEKFFNGGDGGVFGGADNIGAMYFYGRIHACPGVPGITTPHSAFGNPCAMNATNSPYHAAMLVKKHTKFISSDVYEGTTIPEIGDLVEVELSSGWSKFNLQYAKFDKIQMASKGEYNEAMLQDTCSSLEAIFNRFDGQNVGDGEIQNVRRLDTGATVKISVSPDVWYPSLTDGKLDNLLSFIGSGEGSYDAMNQGTKNNQIMGSTMDSSTIIGKKLTSMSIGEVMQLQNNPVCRNGCSTYVFAAGRYQIIPDTMPIALEASGLIAEDMFNEENQDRLGAALIFGKRPIMGNYILGKHDNLDAAHLAMAQEWASVPDPRVEPAQSYYGSGNKSSHTNAEIVDILTKTREAVYGSGFAEGEFDRDAALAALGF